MPKVTPDPRLPRTVLSTAFIGKERVFWSSGVLGFKLHKGAEINIPKGFLSDGFSIPKMFQGIFSKSPHYIYAGILHDYLYRSDCPFQLKRGHADNILLFYMKKYGVGFFTRQMIFSSVRVGGWASWRKCKAKFYQTSEKKLVL